MLKARQLTNALAGLRILGGFRTRLGIWPIALLVGFLCLLPQGGIDIFTLRVLTVAWLLATLTLGNTVSLGYAGIFNMSQATFYGIAAYVTAITVTARHAPFELAMVMGVAAAALSGFVVGLTTLRVRGDYWALISMAFTIGCVQVFNNWRSVTGGEEGYFGIPDLSFAGISLVTPRNDYYAALATLIIALIVCWRFTRSFAGRALLAIRYDEAAASMMGISVRYFKVVSVTLSAAIAGLAGSMLVAVTGFVSPGSFDLLPSFDITIFTIVGGPTSLIGGVTSATLLTFITEQFREAAQYRLLIYGGVLLLAIFVRTGVALGALRAIIRVIPRRSPAVVASQ